MESRLERVSRQAEPSFFPGAVKRRPRNPEKQEIPMFLDSGLRPAPE
jgi:hypothetical protein